jgi:hypothetical protein
MAKRILFQDNAVYGNIQGMCVVNIITNDSVTEDIIPMITNALNIAYDGDGDGMFDNILQGSACVVGLEVTLGSDLDTFLNNLVGDESQYFIEVLRNGNREWIGKILTDTSTHQDTSEVYSYTLTATCGLASLQEYDFDFAFTSVDTHFTLGNCLRNALLPTYTDWAYSTTDVHIVSTLNAYELNQAAFDDTNCPLELSRCLRSAFIKDVEDDEAYNCAEIIELILRPFGCRIRMQNGSWQIIKPDAFTQTNVRVFRYGNRSYTSGPLSTALLTHQVSEDTGNLRTMAGNAFAYKPALIRVDTDWKPNSSLIVKKAYSGSVLDFNASVADLDTYSLEFSASITYEVPRVILNGTSKQDGTVRFYFIVKAYSDNGTVDKYRLVYDETLGFYWTTDLNAFAWYDMPEVTDQRTYDTQDFRVIIPINNDTTIDTINIRFYPNVLNSTCSANISWGGTLELKQEFGNTEFEDDLSYQANNTVLSSNSVYKRSEILIGDSNNSFVAGAIEVNNGTEWQRSAAWYLTHLSGSNYPIGMLLSRTILRMQRVSIGVYQGGFYFGNELTPFNTIVYSGRVYFFNSGDWDYKENTINGDWIAIQGADTGIGTDTTAPRLSETAKLKKQIKRLQNQAKDTGVGLGQQGAIIKQQAQEIERLKRLITTKQDDIWRNVIQPEGYIPGDEYNVKIKEGDNGEPIISIG